MGFGKPLHQREESEFRGWPDFPQRKQQETRVSAVFWIETMLVKKRWNLPGDTTIPMTAHRFAGSAFASELLDRPPRRNGGEVEQIQGDAI